MSGRDGAPALMDEAATAEYLAIPRGTLSAWRKRRQGPPYVKVGRLVRYDPRAVDKWVHKQTVSAV